MTTPLRTAGQFLAESGFGAPPSVELGFPEFPAENAQLQALRKLDPMAREVSWIEHLLTRAREAQLAGDPSRAADEIGAARKLIVDSFRSRTPAGRWAAVALVLALIAVGALVWWWQQRKDAERRRLEDSDHEDEADDDDDEDTDEEQDAA